MMLTTRFKIHLLHPRYWMTYLGISSLYLLVLLPYPVIFLLGKFLGRVSKYFLKKRVQIAERNLQLCFPEMNSQEIQIYIDKNFESVGMGVFESGMAWFWPNWRIRRWVKVDGIENILSAKQTGRGIIVLGIHFLTLELGARALGMINPGVGVYRANNNGLIDWIQLRGRLRSNKYMIDRKKIISIVHALKRGEILWYAPDHDYGPKSSVFAPFFGVKNTATTSGSQIILRLAKPLVISFIPKRLPDGKGYKLIIQPSLDNFPVNDSVATATMINQIIEKEIIKAPEQYMWLHRRFKTRPKGEPSLYSSLDKVFLNIDKTIYIILILSIFIILFKLVY
ncbi:Lipid A biosynthesis lauroyl acyltransferase [Candidatus Providencia siddallii]|uniref:Lipid A biosynthesis acyltransferase n=1 Tax=Candidatus Providencia siddallii TaxID=1715285 RepID=A0A0M6W6M9_9GAMM|nr:Lipid A biosynthesis lauroyl acyltransferase [Candidatus Providencia siddallii]